MLKIFQLLSIIHQVSPEMRKSIHGLLDQAKHEAEQSPGKVDDQAMQLIIGIATLIGLY